MHSVQLDKWSYGYCFITFTLKLIKLKVKKIIIVTFTVCEGMSYGLDCAFNCSWCRNGTSCHHENGTCIHGCDDGLTGDKCQIGE